MNYKSARSYHSTRQVLFYVLSAILITILLMIGFGFLKVPEKESSREENLSAEALESPVPVLTLETNVPDLENSLRQTDNDYSVEELRNIEIFEKYHTAVVNITTQVVVGYNLFLEAVPREGAAGSGAIIDRRGIILTNYHVVEGAYKVYITFSDKSQLEGEVIGTDPQNDLSIISFDPGERDLTTIPLGQSEDLRVGQKVLALGNPFALELTMTTGIVSGLNRPLQNESGYIIKDMIQTNASINPGNSGGPLLNMKGELIGINTMIYSPSGGSVGIGFAVPVDTAVRVLPDLLESGKVNRGWINIEAVQLYPTLIRYAGLDVSEGLLVSRIRSGGAAEEAGIIPGTRQNAVRTTNGIIYLGGDIITGLDTSPITSLMDLYNFLEDKKPGDIVTVQVMRNGKLKELELILEERPES